MPKYDDFDLDIQNTTTQSMEKPYYTEYCTTVVTVTTFTKINCTAFCNTNQCSNICPGPTYDYRCKR